MDKFLSNSSIYFSIKNLCYTVNSGADQDFQNIGEQDLNRLLSVAAASLS